MQLRMSDHLGLVHYEEDAWWPWCTWPREQPFKGEELRACNITQDPPTCLWCVARRKRA